MDSSGQDFPTNEQIQHSADEFLNRAIYEQLSSEILDSVADDQLQQTVFDNLMTKMNKDMSNEVEVFLKFTEGQKAVYAIWLLEAEINNGGFNQYYFNPSGKFALYAIDALNLIGAPKYAELVHRANEIYKANEKQITSADGGTLEGFFASYEDNPLEKLDKEFFQLEREENLSALGSTYIRKNKSEFTN